MFLLAPPTVDCCCCCLVTSCEESASRNSFVEVFDRLFLLSSALSGLAFVSESYWESTRFSEIGSSMSSSVTSSPLTVATSPDAPVTTFGGWLDDLVAIIPGAGPVVGLGRAAVLVLLAWDAGGC